MNTEADSEKYSKVTLISAAKIIFGNNLRTKTFLKIAIY